MLMKKINGHGHLLPYPKDIPQFMQDQKHFWVSEDGKFMCQGDWTRPITDESFFLNEKLAWMDKHEIAHEVVLTLSQLYCNGLNEQTCYDIIRFQNDFNAKVQAEHSDRFTTGFVVQPAYIDQSLKEIERCVAQHQLKLLCLSTHFLNQDGEWVSVADDSVAPIFELADQYQLAIEIHPYDADKLVNMKNTFWRHHLVWMMAQTADTYMMYVFNGLAQKYPNIRTCFAHGAMLAQANHARVIQGLEGRPDLFPGAHHPNEVLGHKNIYFDTLVHDPYTLQLMINRHGSNQILCGIDDPYPLGEMETVPGWYPGKLLDEAVDKEIISQKQRSDIWCDNVLRWIGG
ncbi:amidohydrolase family protein [Aliikangiella marina]|uniref:Amidohydrolase family protein n=2 Tax=Aliikangiella marina TaxID=1712262 RepID=A0A545T1L4_9GAMM|nr:amidohydrolase family protein [Aliikangiella marina]